jgi:FAD:protein FMN transferase
MKSLLFPAIIVYLFTGCAEEVQNTIILSGPAQGTTYNITYVAGAYANYRSAVDSIFHTIDKSLSTYQQESIISKINRNETTEVDTHFKAVFNQSKVIYEKTGGLFDPTVAPLVNAYGFGFKKKEMMTPASIDSLKKIIGFRHVWIGGNKLFKRYQEVILDFNAIAPGYTVDVLAAFLESKGIHHYLIELGGEVRSKGKKLDGSAWTLGIEQPEENASGGSPPNPDSAWRQCPCYLG